MPPKKICKEIEIKPRIHAYSDELTIRLNISDILGGIVNNNDIVAMVQSIISKIKESDQFKVTDEKAITKMDTTLLQEAKDEPIHKPEKTDFIKTGKVESFDDETPPRRRRSTIKIPDFSKDPNMVKQVESLRYRERVFRAASRLNKEMPPFPIWSYRDYTNKLFNTKKINVGGTIFEIFEDTIFNIINTKLSNCISDHKYDEVIFIDRDPVCFNSVLNFYRTGRLHTPPNICLTYFEDELTFWGVNEEFLETCCSSDFQTFKNASNKLKKYSEDRDKIQSFSQKHVKWNFKYRKEIYLTLTTSTNSKVSQWMALTYTTFIIIGIMSMIIGTTPLGRADKKTHKMTDISKKESVSDFLKRTQINSRLANIELCVAGFFFFELCSKVILCPSKLEFLSDPINWIDIIATLTSVVGATPLFHFDSMYLEIYILILKLPRILRLFRLTETLRFGMGAFTLTIQACVRELKLVIVILIIATVAFGVLMFAVEFTGPAPNINNIYIGMWWSIVTMSGVGFGDFYPKTTFGYLIGGICIVTGVVICQIPVPIFLKNFSIYYNQASARLVSQSKLLLFQNIDKTKVRDIEESFIHKSKFHLKLHNLRLRNRFSQMKLSKK